MLYPRLTRPFTHLNRNKKTAKRSATCALALSLEPRRLLATVSWDGGGDGIHWDDPANWSGNVAPVGGDDVVLDVPGTAATVVRQSTPTFHSLLNRESITVRGNGNAGGVGLYVGEGGITNSGGIDLTSIDSTWGSELWTNGSLTNQATGTIQSLTGFGGPRTLTVAGTFTNAGFLGAQGALNAIVTTLQNSGTMTTTSRLTFINTAATWTQGTNLTGPVYQRGGSANITATTSGFTLLTEGVTGFRGNSSPNATVWVQGNGLSGGAWLEVPATGATNLGTIRLESIDSTWESSISVFDPGVLTLGSTGVIRSAIGNGGPRRVMGKVKSSGLFEAPGYSLEIFGTVEMNGGRADSNVLFRAVTLTTTASPPSATTLLLSGQTIFGGNVASGYTLWVQGNGAYGGAVLNMAANGTNNGTIRLESIDSTWESSILLGTGVELTNNGVIAVNAGSAGLRQFFGRLNNAATGQVNVAAGVGFYLSAFNSVLATRGLVTQSGTITVGSGSRFTIDFARLRYSNASNGTLVTRNTEIDVTAGVATSTVIAEGANTLVANASSNVTIWVQGNGIAGASILATQAGGATNAGILRLESVDSTWESSIDATNGLINAATGVIRSVAGMNGPRSLSGAHTNRGLIESPGYTFNVYGTHTADGGRATNDIIFHGVTLSTIGSYALATTLRLSGITTLLTDVPTNMELWVQGNGIDGGASLTRSASMTNNGTIRLESIDSTWGVALAVGGNLTNNGLLQAGIGSGGPRLVDIAGNLDGTGSTQILQSDSSLLANRIRQTTFTLPDGATAIIRPNGTNAGTSKANFVLGAASHFIVNDNAVILDYSGASILPQTGALMQAGYWFGTWNGPNGISSTLITPGRSLGYSEATEAGVANGTFAGLSVDATAVLVRQTLIGDLNLDRLVNFDDLLRVAQNYGMTSGARWSLGDCFYDGNVNFDDLLGLAQQYGQTYQRSRTGMSANARDVLSERRSIV